MRFDKLHHPCHLQVVPRLHLYPDIGGAIVVIDEIVQIARITGRFVQEQVLGQFIGLFRNTPALWIGVVNHVAHLLDDVRQGGGLAYFGIGLQGALQPLHVGHDLGTLHRTGFLALDQQIGHVGAAELAVHHPVGHSQIVALGEPGHRVVVDHGTRHPPESQA